MRRLFTYCIPWDEGGAPNPFWGICTLAICKPAIRRTARVGDWVAGTGSKYSRGSDLSGRLVYAMEVSSIMTLAEYDAWTRDHAPKKIPDLKKRDLRRRVGDSIYDFSAGQPQQRPGVHGKGNIRTDLSGEYVLLSLNFYYFGDQAVVVPDYLSPIVHQAQGHKVNANGPYVERFLKWLKAQGYPRNCLFGKPTLLERVATGLAQPARARRRCAEADEGAPES